MVTFARLVPMPLLCWLVYRGEIWTALVLGSIIGCTDFVDGYLARKYGPTVLGGLMDPIADKVFIAFAYFPFADMGVVPAWAVALMFAREFLVTALRSGYEQRGLTMKTSYFAKVKTWTQMQGLGMLLLFLLLEGRPDIMTGLIVALIAGPIVAGAALWIIKRRFWPGALIMSALTVPLLLLHLYSPVALILELIMIAVVVITWLSGLDYVLVGVRQLRGRGDFGGRDVVRITGAIALPCLIFAALVQTAMPAWPLVTILAVELAIGGLDNLLAHHKVAAGALAWGARVLGISLLLAAGLIASAMDVHAALPYLAITAAAISIIGTAIEFWRGRDCYLDRRLRNQALDRNLGSTSGAEST
jgi:CDP-diacylglycerol--glycerol-3-phosphate 3-phosphatidyltransferase